MTTDDDAITDRLVRRRARIATAFGIIFLATQAASIDRVEVATRPATLHLAAWVLWAAALLLFLVAGGGLWRGPRIRGLLNDETTVDHRRRALATGFWFAVLTALLVYGLSFVEPVGGREATRLVVTIAVAAALIRFGMLERRALAGG